MLSHRVAPTSIFHLWTLPSIPAATYAGFLTGVKTQYSENISHKLSSSWNSSRTTNLLFSHPFCAFPIDDFQSRDWGKRRVDRLGLLTIVIFLFTLIFILHQLYWWIKTIRRSHINYRYRENKLRNLGATVPKPFRWQKFLCRRPSPVECSPINTPANWCQVLTALRHF